MGKQLIFCVESDKNAKTDYIYIKNTIEHFYRDYDRSQIRIEAIYMKGKGNYSKPTIRNRIEELRKQYLAANPDGENVVIYCFDCDSYDSKPEDRDFLISAREYCRENGYRFVWFCRDIEEVYLGKTVSGDNKRKESVAFAKNHAIELVDKNRLKETQYRDKCSNLCAVLEEYI